MAFSHDVPDIPAYHSPGRCIYCMKEFPPEQLREEHIIPLALGGTWRIEHAACFPCQNDTNRLYENAALNSDMIRVPRALLELKRRRQKQKPPIWFPPLFPSNTASATNVGHLPQKTVARDEYPALFAMIVMEPPGKLAPSYFPKRQPPRNKLRIWIRSIEENVPSAPIVSDEINFPGGYDKGQTILTAMDLNQKEKPPVSLRQRLNVRAFALMLAKIGYCFGVAGLGLDGFDGSKIRDLLRDERKDVFNFVGNPVDGGNLTQRYLHQLAFRDRGDLLSVIIHLFASYQAPVYEVVIGKRK
jgi:HNH endonuclease